MKKIMIAAAIVCAAVVSQGATATWATGTVYNGSEGTWTGKNESGNYLENGSASLFILGTGVKDDLGQVMTDWAMLSTSEAIWNAYDASAGTLTVNGHTYTAYNSQDFDDYMNSGYIQFTPSQNADPGQYVYGAIVMTATKGGEDLYAASAFTDQFGTSGPEHNIAGKVGQYWYSEGGVQGNQSVWNAAAVPEPTSGLLLLLGVAGLALRRRRA